MTKDIIKAISKKLKTLYPTYKIYVDEVKQGLTEPCFFIKLISDNLEKKFNLRREKEINFDVICLMDKNDEEINFDYQDISDSLQENLELLQVGTSYLRIKNKQAEVIDDILHFKFKVVVSVYITRNVEPVISSAKINFKSN